MTVRLNFCRFCEHHDSMNDERALLADSRFAKGGGVDRRAADSRHVPHERRGHSRPLVERSLRIHAASRHQSFGSRTIFPALLFRSSMDSRIVAFPSCVAASAQPESRATPDLLGSHAIVRAKAPFRRSRIRCGSPQPYPLHRRRSWTSAPSFAAASRSLTAARRSAYVGSTSMTLSAQGIGQFGSAREFSNGGVSAAPVG